MAIVVSTKGLSESFLGGSLILVGLFQSYRALTYYYLYLSFNRALVESNQLALIKGKQVVVKSTNERVYSSCFNAVFLPSKLYNGDTKYLHAMAKKNGEVEVVRIGKRLFLDKGKLHCMPFFTSFLILLSGILMLIIDD